MCVLCTRRTALFGTLSLVLVSPSMAAPSQPKVACGFGGGPSSIDRRTKTSTSGNRRLDEALVAEISHVLSIIPVNPGFQYIQLDNAAASEDPAISGTEGTVWLGLEMIQALMKEKDGGATVAGILAHECAHIFQFFSPYYERLSSKLSMVEHHADLLAGYYMGRRPSTTPERIGRLASTLMERTGYKDASHGLPPFRPMAVYKGYQLAQAGASFAMAALEGEKYVRRLHDLP